jgi:hypothetical protein
MYPGMAKTAREEGFSEIADWFETLAKAASRFSLVLVPFNDIFFSLMIILIYNHSNIDVNSLELF